MRVVAVSVALLVGCTGGAQPDAPPGAQPEAAQPEAPLDAPVLALIVTANDPADAPYLEGLELANSGLEEPFAIEVHDDEGDPSRAEELLREILADPRLRATLLVGDPRPAVRTEIEVRADGRPVLLLGGDLYSTRQLYPQIFQSSTPDRWQAHAIARYLARDRGHRRIVVLHEEERSPRAFVEALVDEGLPPAATIAIEGAEPGAAIGPGPSVPDPDAVLAIGPPSFARAVARGLPAGAQLVVTNEALSADLDLPPGTVAPGTYTWAPWANPIPRVAEFRAAFEEHHGHPPVGPEQQSHDAVRLLGAALERTAGRSGAPLVAALERNRPVGPTFSALPLVLGPDDHTLADETWVGLFAVPAPGAPREVDTTPWRPLVRTFTSDGERTIFREEDRAIFFPFWREMRPSPKYWRAAIGVATGPDDPLH